MLVGVGCGRGVSGGAFRACASPAGACVPLQIKLNQKEEGCEAIQGQSQTSYGMTEYMGSVCSCLVAVHAEGTRM